MKCTNEGGKRGLKKTATPKHPISTSFMFFRNGARRAIIKN